MDGVYSVHFDTLCGNVVQRGIIVFSAYITVLASMVITLVIHC